MRIESLERRSLLSTVTWDGGGGGDTNFATPANWSTDQLPTSGDDVVIGASSGTRPTLSYGTSASYKSLTVSGPIYLIGNLQLAGDFHVLFGGNVLLVGGGTVQGMGKVIVDAGASFAPEIAGFSPSGGNIRMPVDNYGTFGIAGKYEFGPEFHNYATVIASEGGDCYGNFYNEAGAKLSSLYLPSSPSTLSLGLQRSTTGVISPALFVNRGTVYSGDSTPAFAQQLVINLSGTPTLGGTFYGNQEPLIFAGSGTTKFDETFQFAAGQLEIYNANTTVRGMADGTSLLVNGSVTLVQPRTSLKSLKINGALSLAVGMTNGVLRTESLRFGSGGTLNVADNLAIDGNKPALLIHESGAAGSPLALPTYHSNLRGNVNGQVLTVNTGVDPTASTSRAVGFSNGASLAGFYPSHTFRGETFDNDDFVFFPTLRGDANFDRSVDFNDLVSLSQHYGTTTSRGFADGNFDSPASNSAVDFNDLVLLAQNYGASFAIAPAITLAPVTGKTTATKRRADSAGELSL